MRKGDEACEDRADPVPRVRGQGERFETGGGVSGADGAGEAGSGGAGGDVCLPLRHSEFPGVRRGGGRPHVAGAAGPGGEVRRLAGGGLCAGAGRGRENLQHGLCVRPAGAAGGETQESPSV